MLKLMLRSNLFLFKSVRDSCLSLRANRYCGVLSYFYSCPRENQNIDNDRNLLINGLKTLKHRGPDGEPSFWIDEEHRVGLGHTRLAIIDLSDHGRQPMHSVEKDVYLSMNGELYDHDRIRREAIEKDQYQFLSESDSEIAIYLYKKFGFAFTKYLRGEFAITMFDKKRKIFIAVRDRFGIKPLFYTNHRGKLVFASEIKALFAFGVPAVWNEEAIYNLGFYRSTQTVFKNIFQLPPGHILIGTGDGSVNISKYYDVNYATRLEEANDERSEQEIIENVRKHLIEAVQLRMRADVKVGVYLSGGLDSSTILGIASGLTDKPIDTYSVAFKDHPHFDEQDIIERTNQHWGSNRISPHILQLTQNQLADHIDDCIFHYEYPLRYISSVAKLLLSRSIRENDGKVVLSGEGSDEIFAGYSYFRQNYLQFDYEHSEVLLKEITPEKRKELLSSLTSGILSGAEKPENEDLLKAVGFTPTLVNVLTSIDANYFSCRAREKFSNFPSQSFYYTSNDLFDFRIRDQMLKNEISRVHSTEYIIVKNFLLNILLTTYGDRSEMANSVEGRTPFLDHFLVDYVNKLPTHVKIKFIDGKLNEKNVLKLAARPFVTEQVFRREKHPFLAPPSFVDRNSKVHQYFREKFYSSTMKELDFIFDVEQIQKSFEKTCGENAKSLSLRELIDLEGVFLMLSSFVTLKDRFDVRFVD